MIRTHTTEAHVYLFVDVCVCCLVLTRVTWHCSVWKFPSVSFFFFPFWMYIFLLLLCWIFDRTHSHFCASSGPTGHQRNHCYSELQCHTWPQGHHQVVSHFSCIYTYILCCCCCCCCLCRNPLSVFSCIKCGLHHFYSFRWDRGGKPVLPTSGGRISVRQSSLTIGQTWSGDIGDYTCTVTSAAGNDSRTARLEVMWVP